MSEEYLSKSEKDQLVEVINIGAGNASTALSQMIGKQVKVTVPEAKVGKVENVPEILGKLQKVMTVVLLKILGDAPGIMLLMFPPDSAITLAGLLTKRKEKDIKILDEMDRSALRELGNILAGASLTALSKFLDMNLLESVPEAATDMLGSVVDSILAEIGQESDIILLFKVNFDVKDEDVDGKLFFLFDPKSTAKILEITKKLENDKKKED